MENQEKWMEMELNDICIPGIERCDKRIQSVYKV